MKPNLVSRISLFVYAIVIGVFGVHHLQVGASMAGYVPSYFPAHTFLIYFTGACFILAAISFLLNVKVRLAGYLLGTLLLIILGTIQIPGWINATDANAQMMAMISVLKDTAIAASAFYIGSRNS